MMIPDFNLPSQPGVTVRMREATVSDAIDFADVDAGREELATSLFLERVQDKAMYSDPRTWTAEDRRFALYWYWLHTTPDKDIPLTYECQHCGKTHTALVDGLKLADAYKPMKGKPSRDLDFKGAKIIVHPVNGAAMEEIELAWMAVAACEAEHGESSGRANKKRAQAKLLHLLRAIQVEGHDDAEKFILSLTTTDFAELATLVDAALKDMEHGLEGIYEQGRIFLIVPEIQCDEKEGPEFVVKLRYPFRTFDYIPGV